MEIDEGLKAQLGNAVSRPSFETHWIGFSDQSASMLKRSQEAAGPRHRSHSALTERKRLNKKKQQTVIKHQNDPGEQEARPKTSSRLFSRGCLLRPDSSGTNVSVCSWGCSATFGHCCLNRTRGVNEVQQPLCKTRLFTRHRRYGEECVCVRGTSLFVLH